MKILIASLFCASPLLAVQWQSDYSQALETAKQKQKPIALYFTGSDWCQTCKNFEEDILNQPNFTKAIGDNLLFVKIDFPMQTQQPLDLIKKNKALQDQYSVKSFPMLILVDSNEHPIAITGYKQVKSEAYANYLIKMLQEYRSFREQMLGIDSKNLSGKELKRLYQKADELSQKEDINHLLKLGQNSDLPLFFLTEKYRRLVDQGLKSQKDTIALRESILRQDVQNKNLSHYQVAVIDFEACCQEFDGNSVEKAIEPLNQYLNQFGPNDQENYWRLNMVISQMYLDKNRYKEALNYAKKSYESAPTGIKGDIAFAIKSIEKKMH